MGIVLSYAFAHIIEAVILWMSMSQMYEHRYKQWLKSVYKELHADHETGAADNK